MTLNNSHMHVKTFTHHTDLSALNISKQNFNSIHLKISVIKNAA